MHLQGDEEKQSENTREAKLSVVAAWLLNPTRKDPAPHESLAALKEKLKAQGLLDVFLHIEAPLIPILEGMEKQGIRVDKRVLEELEIDLKKERQSLKRELFRLAGEEFNPSSPDQLRSIFFEKLKLSHQGMKKTPGGKLSTQERELVKIAYQHEIIPYVLAYRELEKILNTYVTPFFQKIEKDGRIHTHFNQTGTSTGRLSSQNPNLQNIPTEGKWAKRVKNMFIADEGFSLVSFDYSQIELRVAAHLAKDEDLIKAFRNGEDIHTHTAARVFNVPQKEVTPSMRRTAKMFNFGILYGLSSHGLAENLRISRDEAQRFITAYFERFSGVKAYIEKTRQEVAKKGYLQTLLGRKRWFPELQDQENLPRTLREALFREAVNFPIQGTATGDIIKLAMIGVYEKFLGKKQRDARLLLQIHDDLLFEIQDESIAPFAKAIKDIMESVAHLDVPLLVEIKAGKRWGDLASFKPF